MLASWHRSMQAEHRRQRARKNGKPRWRRRGRTSLLPSRRSMLPPVLVLAPVPPRTNRPTSPPRSAREPPRRVPRLRHCIPHQGILFCGDCPRPVSPCPPASALARTWRSCSSGRGRCAGEGLLFLRCTGAIGTWVLKFTRVWAAVSGVETVRKEECCTTWWIIECRECLLFALQFRLMGSSEPGLHIDADLLEMIHSRRHRPICKPSENNKRPPQIRR